MRHAFAALGFLLVACGGSKGRVAEPPVALGQAHETTPPAEPPPAPPPEESPPAEPAEPPAAVTIVLENEGDSDLSFGVTKGWGPVLFGYTGKPPKAKAVILFASACTASCDASPDELCPECPEPQTKKEELAMARIETAPAGSSISVPWDGLVLDYVNAPGRKRCKCWRKSEPAAGTYTIKGCGLRPATEPGKPSRPVCSETQVAFAPGEMPRTITLQFKK